MKKTAYLLFTLMLASALMLTGCKSTQEDAPVAPENDPPVQENAVQPSEDEEKLEPTSLGTLEDNVYTNTYTGFTCEMGGQWAMLGAEDLQDIPDAITEMLKDTEVGADMEAASQIMDLYAQNMENGTTVNLLYTAISAKDRLAFRLMSEEKMLDQLLEDKDSLISSYAATGVEVQSMEKDTVDFLGEEHTVCKTMAKVQGQDACMVQLFNYKLPGRYGITLTVSGRTEEDVEDALSCFSPLE